MTPGLGETARGWEPSGPSPRDTGADQVPLPNHPGMNAVYVAVDYTVTVDLPGYPFDMHFTPSSGNRGF